MTPRSFLADVASGLRFYSRLPAPQLGEESDSHAMFDFARATYAVPVAGAVIGGCGALVLIAAWMLGLPPLVMALFCIAALVWLSGALHEDGLADYADGLGGGRDQEERLAIMRDSRIGSYGAVALILGVGLRAAALSTLIDRGVGAAAAAVIAAAALSRGLGLLPLVLLDPARRDGAGHAAAPPRGLPLAGAAGLAGLLALVPMLGGVSLGHAVAAFLAAVAAALAVTRVAARAIGGQTGDVAGAAQQVAEIAYFCALVAAPHLH